MSISTTYIAEIFPKPEIKTLVPVFFLSLTLRMESIQMYIIQMSICVS